MEQEKKSIFYIILALIIIAFIGWWLYSGSKTSPSGSSTASSEPAPAEAQLAPALQLTKEEKRGDVSEKKAQIIARVRSNTPLTSEEKADIGGIMLTKANIYNFSEEERVDIFEALSK